MPSYSSRGRSGLLAVAPPLIERARRHFSEPSVLEAAEAAEAARRALAEAVDARQGAGEGRSGASARVEDAERGLDRRVTGLAEALRGLSRLGLADADALEDALLPQGTEGHHRPRGRLQVPAYELLAKRIRAAQGTAAAARLEPALGELADDLELWCVEVMVRDEAADGLEAAARGAAAATEALRAALTRLDATVALAAGGPRAEAYAAWASGARGVG